ncbi:MAG: DAK2 domain-containing protein [Candidatus Moduliflexus flocculans]|nr:DAK2 domain-containing protein [Candidatus Moduliflexus flocculans]
MRSIAAGAKAYRSATEALGSIADAALVGARGNSGLIFAQFLYGLSQEVRGEHRLSVHRFAESVRRAVQHARRAVLTPVEGTMITLLHDWAEALYEQRLKMTDFAELLSYSLPIAERSLADTPKKLAVLARAGVVDAGAKGFFDFLQGVVGFIRKGSIKNIRAAEAADLPRAGEVPSSRSIVTKRFCSEALLVGEAIDVAAVQDLVRRSGESAVVAGSPRKLRLHVHTDDAAGLFFELQRHGTIQDIKADDMLRQFEAAHERKAPIAVLTDSACDLPRGILDDHQVHVVPVQSLLRRQPVPRQGDDRARPLLRSSPDQTGRAQERPAGSGPRPEGPGVPGRPLRRGGRRLHLGRPDRFLRPDPPGARGPRPRRLPRGRRRFPPPVRLRGPDRPPRRRGGPGRAAARRDRPGRRELGGQDAPVGRREDAEIHGPRRPGQPAQGTSGRGPQHQAHRHPGLRRQGSHPGQILQPPGQHEEDPRPHPQGGGRPARLELRPRPRPEPFPRPALRRSPRSDARKEARLHLRGLPRRRGPQRHRRRRGRSDLRMILALGVRGEAEGGRS